MEFLNAEIGSAKDNAKSPIHNWYKFTAGFSYKFVDDVIEKENLKKIEGSKIFDPFAGCGTTLVSSQKAGVPAVGNEAQEFMYDVIRAKLSWKFGKEQFDNALQEIKTFVDKEYATFDFKKVSHLLLESLYTVDTLKKLYLIKYAILNIEDVKLKLFFKLALSQTLHKVSIHPIAVPYISRNKFLNNTDKPWEFFENISQQMFADTTNYIDKSETSEIHLQDSRLTNNYIEDASCNVCITSPPYLNNLDYGEVSKVHTHFFDITNNWNDITKNVRKKLVTGATTHYNETDFSIEKFKTSNFYIDNSIIADELLEISKTIKAVSKERSGKKSFDILTLLYFNDMYEVLKEIRRVVKAGSCAYLILGDSAPYGIRVATTELLGRISLNLGFKNYEIHKIRTRGTKWKSLKHRHSLELTENVLIIK